MTIEIIFLALVSTVRPTSLAAVYAMLATSRSRRLLPIYILSGLAFTIGFGLLVVLAFNGIDIGSGSDDTEELVEIIAGVGLLAFAVAMLTGLIGGARPEDAPKPGGRWNEMLEKRLTVRTAALAGPATHIPGLFYLVALNLIVGHHPGIIIGLVEVLIYNTIWFAIPFAALVLSIFAPDLARERVGMINDWARRNTRAIVIVVSIVMGVALIIRATLL